MKVRDYVLLLKELESKRVEFENIVKGNVGVYTTAILQREIEDAITDIMALENLELEIKPQVIRVGVVGGDLPLLAVGEKTTIALEYTLTNGEMKAFGAEPKAHVILTDIDAIYNNEGFITEFDAKDYNGTYDMSLKLTRTANGFDVFDDSETQGLQVVTDADGYVIVDTFGKSLGLKFKERDTVPGDDFRVLVIRNKEALTLSVGDESVATLDGLTIEAITAGDTQLFITAGEFASTVTIEVQNAPEVTPEPEPTPEPEEPVVTEPEVPTIDNTVKRMTVNVGDGLVEAVVTDGNVAIELPVGTVTSSIEVELEDGTVIPADAKVVVNYTPSGGVSADTWVDYGTITVLDNIATITPNENQGVAGYVGTVNFKVVNADESDIEGLDLPTIALTVVE